jgi:type III pantothenate kinase
MALLLTIDIGNTNTVLGVFDGERVIEHWRIATVPDRTADELAVVLHGLLARSSAFAEKDVDGISLCSTVPSVLHEMREMCKRYYGEIRTVIVEPGVKTGVPVRTDNPKEVGSDRIMNSLAVVHLYGGPAVVVDFGTSTNFDAVSADGEFVGGVLAPGIEISVDALSRRAAQLLKVELTKPPRVIGKNTVESLQSGIIYGFAAQVEGVARRMAQELSPKDPDRVTIIATGGLAPLVIGEVSIIDAYEPWLTLIGLRLVYEKNPSLLDADGTDVIAPEHLVHPDRDTVRGRVDHQAVAEVDAHVADVGAEEHQIARLEVVTRDVHAGVPQVAGVVRQADPELAERPHHKPGAVEVVRPGRAPVVRVAPLSHGCLQRLSADRVGGRQDDARVVPGLRVHRHRLGHRRVVDRVDLLVDGVPLGVHLRLDALHDLHLLLRRLLRPLRLVLRRVQQVHSVAGVLVELGDRGGLAEELAGVGNAQCLQGRVEPGSHIVARGQLGDHLPAGDQRSGGALLRRVGDLLVRLGASELDAQTVVLLAQGVDLELELLRLSNQLGQGGLGFGRLRQAVACGHQEGGRGSYRG